MTAHPYIKELEHDAEVALAQEATPYQAGANGTLPSADNTRPSTLAPTHDSHALTARSETTLQAERSLSNEKIPDKPLEDEAAPAGLLTGAKLYLVFLSMMLCVLMFALDQSIVSTAIPDIVSQFQAFDQVAWIVTGYFLTQCGLILLVGQMLTVIKAKWMLLAAIFFFELGSLLCAVANSMALLIFARAVQGIGASGMFVSILATIATITTLQQRPAFMGAFGVVFVISSVIGPLLGGVFTQRVSWRWCFWINLPFGGVAAAAVFFLLPATEPSKEAVGVSAAAEVQGWRKLLKMDFVGSALVLALVTCLLLALQWGGNQYAWGNWRIILLFCVGGVLIPVFGFWQWKIDKAALIPLVLLRNRTLVASSGAVFVFMMAMLGGTYQLPLFYQATRGRTPEQSGIDIIPFMLSACVGIFVSGGLVTKFGRYYPFILAGPIIAAIGFGLLYTMTADIANPKIIGYQILSGFGVGLAFQNFLLAIQAEYHDRPHLIPQASSVVSFFQLVGGALGVGIINTVQSVYLNSEIPRLAPEAPFQLVRQSTAAIGTLPPAVQTGVIQAYVIAITNSFIPIIAAVGLALVFSAFVRNHDVRAKGVAGGAMVA